MSQPSPNDLPLFHLVRQPDRPSQPSPSQRPPLLALLHGLDANERELFKLAPELDARFLILSLRAPLAHGPDRYAWFIPTFTSSGPVVEVDQLEASRKRIVQFLREAVVAYNADPARVYLLGFSQGAIMSFTLALTEPRLLAGVVAIAGRIPPEVQPWAVAPDETAGLPLLLQHGRDDQVLPIFWAHRARLLLEQQRITLDYREYDAEHRVAPRMREDAAAWLTACLDEPSLRSSQG